MTLEVLNVKKAWVIMQVKYIYHLNHSRHYSRDHHHHHLDHTLKQIWIILQSYPAANVYDNTDDRKENKMKGKEDTKQSEPRELMKNEVNFFLSVIFIYYVTQLKS